MTKRFGWFMALTVILSAVSGWSCARGYAGPVASISIGFRADQTAAEVYVAQDRGFFAQNGLNVTIKPYETGLAAINGVLLDELDIAGSAEIALVGKALEHQAIGTIGVANKIDSFKLVGRRDKGIEDIADLSSKRIGVTLQTIGEFYLSRFLELHGLSPSKVAMIDVPPSQLVEAITSGTVDAVVFLQPVVGTLEKQLGTNAISWKIQSNQAIFGMFISKDAWVIEHPDLAKRFLKAIEQANDYVMEHPGEAKTILKDRLDYTDEYLESVWPENSFSLSLDQSLVAAMEDEARWMIANHLTTEDQVPNFNDYIYEDALKAIKPHAVNIIR